MITFLPQPNGIETKLWQATPVLAALLNSSLGGNHMSVTTMPGSLAHRWPAMLPSVSIRPRHYGALLLSLLAHLLGVVGWLELPPAVTAPGISAPLYLQMIELQADSISASAVATPPPAQRQSQSSAEPELLSSTAANHDFIAPDPQQTQPHPNQAKAVSSQPLPSQQVTATSTTPVPAQAQQAPPVTEALPDKVRPRDSSGHEPATDPKTAESTRQSARSAPVAAQLNSGSSTAATAAKASWQHQLRQHLEQYKQYPRHARRLRQHGAPVLRFSIDRQGNILTAEVLQSSGSQWLDQAALAMLQRAQPVPAPPEHLTQAELTLTVPVLFELQQE